MHRSSAAERRANLRLMNSNEMLDLSVRLYQQLGFPMLKATALPAVFVFAGLAFLTQIVFPMFRVTSDAANIQVQVLEAVFVVFLAVGVAAPISLLGLSYTSGIVIRLVSDYINGTTPDVEVAKQDGRTALRKLFLFNVYELFIGWSGVLGSLGLLMLSAVVASSPGADSAPMSATITGLAIFGFAVGFVWVAFILARHALAPAATVLEGLGPIAAAKRSVSLLRATNVHMNGYGVLFSLIFLVIFLMLLVSPGIGFGLALIDLSSKLDGFMNIPYLGIALGKTLELLPVYCSVWVLIPVWCTTTTILYFERRIRLEAYDIEALARDASRTQKGARFEL